MPYGAGFVCTEQVTLYTVGLADCTTKIYVTFCAVRLSAGVTVNLTVFLALFLVTLRVIPAGTEIVELDFVVLL